MKKQILELANQLLLEKGYNAFSYKHITEKIDIKTSSIHYHFPTKTDLGIAIIDIHQAAFEQTMVRAAQASPVEKINKIFTYYQRLIQANKVCIAGALTSDINTLEAPLRHKILHFSNTLIQWTADNLREGIDQNIFRPLANPQLKAKQLIASLMAMAQFARLDEGESDFDAMASMMLNELKAETI